MTLVDPATGEVAAAYPREWGDAPTSSANPTLQLKLLRLRPGGWRDSVVRLSLPDDLVAHDRVGHFNLFRAVALSALPWDIPRSWHLLQYSPSLPSVLVRELKANDKRFR